MRRGIAQETTSRLQIVKRDDAGFKTMPHEIT